MARRSPRSALTVRLEVEGLEELKAGLSTLAEGRYQTRALDRSAELAIEVARGTRFRFASGPPVPGILTYRTGALYRSLTVRKKTGGARVGGTSFRDVIFGAGGRHGPLHELGTRRLPKRPVLAPTAETAAPEVAGIFEEELRAELRNAGLA